jgi:hypothetical protein
MPELLEALGLGAHAKASARCPLHDESRPSFSIFRMAKGWRFKCFSGCGEGDELEFLALYKRVNKSVAMNLYRQMTLGFEAGSEMKSTGPQLRTSGERELKLPGDLSEGAASDWKYLAKVRKVSVGSVELAVRLGAVRFGKVCDVPCWILMDQRRLCAEARRMCGSKFLAYGGLPERKAHTLGGSVKKWPLGVALQDPDFFQGGDWIAWVEGGPDYLSVLHYRLEKKTNVVPVAMLGASARIGEEALELFRGRRIRIFAHHDPGEQGRRAAARWGEQLRGVGARVDGWSFEGLRKADGGLVTDLNDCTEIHPEDAVKLEEAWL